MAEIISLAEFKVMAQLADLYYIVHGERVTTLNFMELGNDHSTEHQEARQDPP